MTQLRTLVSQYAGNKTPLQSKDTSAGTNQKKDKVGANITNALNTTDNIPRIVDNEGKNEKKKKGLSLNIRSSSKSLITSRSAQSGNQKQ